jgi:hypothetical protein
MKINLTKLLDIPTRVSFLNQQGDTNYSGLISEDRTSNQPYSFDLDDDKKTNACQFPVVPPKR